MNNSLTAIPLRDLALIFIPPLLVAGILLRWSMDSRGALYALARMVVQLLAIGYLLRYLFDSDSPSVTLLVVAIMAAAASWIAIRPARRLRGRAFLRVLGAISIGGISTLAVVVFGVLKLDPWYTPRVLVPLAGMIFAGAMNATSLAIERLSRELEGGADYPCARRRALGAALLPRTNSLLAVGLVTLPGMMTGQILSGVSPLVAVRYQIVVMCMIFGASGISAACYLVWAESGR